MNLIKKTSVPIKAGGEIYVEGVDVAHVLAQQDTYQQVLAWSDGGAGVNGESKNATPDVSNDHITIIIPGLYLIIWSVSSYSALKNEYEFEIFKNNGDAGFPASESYRTTSTAGAVGYVGGQCLCTLAKDDTIELWVERKDGAAVSKTITIRAATLTLVKIG